MSISTVGSSISDLPSTTMSLDFIDHVSGHIQEQLWEAIKGYMERNGHPPDLKPFFPNSKIKFPSQVPKGFMYEFDDIIGDSHTAEKRHPDLIHYTDRVFYFFVTKSYLTKAEMQNELQKKAFNLPLHAFMYATGRALGVLGLEDEAEALFASSLTLQLDSANKQIVRILESVCVVYATSPREGNALCAHILQKATEIFRGADFEDPELKRTLSNIQKNFSGFLFDLGQVVVDGEIRDKLKPWLDPTREKGYTDESLSPGRIFPRNQPDPGRIFPRKQLDSGRIFPRNQTDSSQSPEGSSHVKHED